ncbi:hypothetical protein AY601_0485 [Pedobacter cryoconitis]|uniref:Uncharacterized protein n=1 Tax=Pedobacter cryoconitis TaxID=188932 RepID=A0A127V853_9SPHI|nr:hypothetical protein [Pedobacter cryoconitis]AMP97440.1 hypothetical protein AY601_0485 [Pedobacter cryoconitis]
MSCIELKRVLDPKNFHENCFSFSSVATENGKKFRIENKSNADICKVKVDGCLITDNTVRKCDFLFEVSSTTKTYLLVELKGGDLNSAVKQIESTYDLLHKKLNVPVENFKGIIVSSAVPRAANLAFRRWQEILRSAKGLHLERKTDQCIYTIL